MGISVRFPPTLHPMYHFLAYALYLLSLSPMHPFLEKYIIYGFPGNNRIDKLISLIRVCSLSVYYNENSQYTPETGSTHLLECINRFLGRHRTVQ